MHFHSFSSLFIPVIELQPHHVMSDTETKSSFIPTTPLHVILFFNEPQICKSKNIPFNQCPNKIKMKARGRQLGTKHTSLSGLTDFSRHPGHEKLPRPHAQSSCARDSGDAKLASQKSSPYPSGRGRSMQGPCKVT